MSEVSVWQVSYQTGSLLAHVTKKAKGLCGFSMTLISSSALSLGLVLLSSELSIILRYALTT